MPEYNVSNSIVKSNEHDRKEIQMNKQTPRVVSALFYGWSHKEKDHASSLCQPNACRVDERARESGKWDENWWEWRTVFFVLAILICSICELRALTFAHGLTYIDSTEHTWLHQRAIPLSSSILLLDIHFNFIPFHSIFVTRSSLSLTVCPFYLLSFSKVSQLKIQLERTRIYSLNISFIKTL